MSSFAACCDSADTLLEERSSLIEIARREREPGRGPRLALLLTLLAAFACGTFHCAGMIASGMTVGDATAASGAVREQIVSL